MAAEPGDEYGASIAVGVALFSATENDSVAAGNAPLRTSATLAGYVTTADGRLLAFAVMVNDVPSGQLSGARDAIDEWATALAVCGCG